MSAVKPGELACVHFSSNSLGSSNRNSYQTISSTQHVWCVRFWKSSHPYIKRQPCLPLLQNTLFPLKEMRKKGDILGAGNTGKRSVAKLACLPDGWRVRIGNKRKKWWEIFRLPKRTKSGGRSPDEETERSGRFSTKEERNETSHSKDVRLWQGRCRWPSWTILDTLIGRTVRTRTTRTFLCCALRMIPSGWSRFLQRQKNFKDSPISSFGSLSLHSCQNVWKRPSLFVIPQVSHICSFKNQADSEA